MLHKTQRCTEEVKTKVKSCWIGEAFREDMKTGGRHTETQSKMGNSREPDIFFERIKKNNKITKIKKKKKPIGYFLLKCSYTVN